MSARETFKNTILPKLESTTIRDRTEGLAYIRSTFANTGVVDTFYLNKQGFPEPLGWLVVFQGLFTAVSTEVKLVTSTTTTKAAGKGKPGSTVTATRRLAEAAGVVRWLVEKTAHLINKTVLKALFEHLLQTMVWKRELLMPVALDYIKALKALLAHPPNMQHTDAATWVRIVELGFNVVLGDPLRRRFDDDDNEGGDWGREEPAVDGQDIGMYEDETIDDDPTSPSTSTSKKRRRTRTRSPTPRPPPPTAKQPPQRTRSTSYPHQPPTPISLEQIEFNSLLTILLSSPSAPFLSLPSSSPSSLPTSPTSPISSLPTSTTTTTSPSSPTPTPSPLPTSLLTRHLAFLQTYPSDTSLHHDYLLSLTHLLTHLSLNRTREVTRFARGAWGALVDLLGGRGGMGRGRGMREGVVGVLGVLLPFFTAPLDPLESGVSGPDNASEGRDGWGEGVAKLWGVLGGGGGAEGGSGRRWGVDLLSLDALRLELLDADHESNACDDAREKPGSNGARAGGRNTGTARDGRAKKQAFTSPTFRAGTNFTPDQALAWAVLELAADCAEKLFQLSESSHPHTQSNTNSKRPRYYENPITALLASLRTVPPTSSSSSLPSQSNTTYSSLPSTSYSSAYSSQTTPTTRLQSLQILLFFIDRHWSVLHASLKRDVVGVLTPLLGSGAGAGGLGGMGGISGMGGMGGMGQGEVGQGEVQSWAFLCFAGIAFAECRGGNQSNNQDNGNLKSGGADLGMDVDTTTPTSQGTGGSWSWDPIWTHAMRRVNVPSVCRAACHAAYTLLVFSRSSPSSTLSPSSSSPSSPSSPSYPHSLSSSSAHHPLLPSPTILTELETLSKDLDIQGPSYPHDSVCSFLSECLRVASQDTRLYRIGLEEKVLGWWGECWRASGVNGNSKEGDGRLPLHTVADVISLLESICGFSESKRSDLVCRVLLPECRVVDVMRDVVGTGVIRDFVLRGRVEGQVGRRVGSGAVIGHGGGGVGAGGGEGQNLNLGDSHEGMGTGMGMEAADLVQPRGIERRISAFMLKHLESLVSSLDPSTSASTSAHPNPQPHLTAEKARRYIDMAVLALSFEGVLVTNGTRSNRRVVQCACRVIALVVTFLAPQSGGESESGSGGSSGSRWGLEEKALILLGLEPLTSIGEEEDKYAEERWETLLPPDVGTGIRREVLGVLMADVEGGVREVKARRRAFQRVIWGSADVQDLLGSVTNTLREVLRVIIGETPPNPSQLMDIDDKDGFGPIRSAQQSSSDTNFSDPNKTQSIRCVIEVCMAFLTVVPILQSTSGEPTRDRELVEMMLCAKERPDHFLLVFPTFLDRVKQRTLNLTVGNFDAFLDQIADMLKRYTYARSERVQLLVIQFLDSTLHIWLADAVVDSDVGEKVRQLCHWLSRALSKKKLGSWTVRDALARFLDRYIALDPRQVAWSDPDEERQERLNLRPSYLLPMLGADVDIRVRFRAAVLNAHLFSIARVLGAPPLGLYKMISDWCTTEVTDYEGMLTRILTLGNIVVISSAVRRGPYWHLLEASLYNPGYSRHIEAILRGVSERMGLSTFSDLFEAYASQFAYSLRVGEQDFLKLPARLLGYPDRKTGARVNFHAFTTTNIAATSPSPEIDLHGRHLFEAHCKVVDKSVKEGIRECFGDIVGFVIATAFCEDPTISRDVLEGLIRTKTLSDDDPESFTQSLQRSADSIVGSILRKVADQDLSHNGPIFSALGEWDISGRAVRTFQALVAHRHADDFETHAPNLPQFDTETILQALDWVAERIPITDTKPITYHVLHEIFAAIQGSPLVNEQFRLINGISIWVACHHSDFDNATLLYTLVHGASALLAQSDLARAAQSMLEWAFSCYVKTNTKDPRFPDILLRVCCLAHDYASKTQDAALAKLGSELLLWFDAQVVKLCRIPNLRDQILRTVPAWPHQPSAELVEMCEHVNSESLSAVLNDSRISSNKFRLVGRLRDRAVYHDYDETRFSKVDFWRLKECIPPAEHLHDEDIQAFAVLLVTQKGNIDGFATESNASSVRASHRRSITRTKDAGDATTPKNAIVIALLTMLDGNAASQVHVAYRTLRLLVSISEDLHLQKWPSEYRLALEYLQEFPQTPDKRLPPDTNKFLASEAYVNAARDFPRWISLIATLLSDTLATTDAFYAQLTSILQSDISFAEQMLPILVHTLLFENAVTNDKTYAASLSKYFTSILLLDRVSIHCVRSVVDIMLHLRNFCPPSKDALAYEKWLDIDFTLLARNAIVCGAYTTALLFLELAAEYKGASATNDPASEQILFDIYSHIDEPDGFYGIQTNDLHRFLIRRFHHEHQWEKAFRFHGAALEAGSANASETEGLLQSFHSFGFDHLAISTLQGSSFGIGSTVDTSAMSYKLGWRTETWDLPNQTVEQTPGASLYLALRAIYRERDPRAVDVAVRHAFSVEIERLRSLGAENLTEIRDVSRNLMCLGQITQWREGAFHSQLKSKKHDIKEWANFTEIDSKFQFSDLEALMATRMSLVRSLRQKEQRERIGDLVTPFIQSLIDVESRCLVRLSEAARDANQIQIALNSVVRAQTLENPPKPDVSQEFSSVLWFQKEEKLAVQFLERVIPPEEAVTHNPTEKSKRALLLARLGAWTSEACLEKPTDILAKYFNPATSLLAEVDRVAPDPPHATVYHQCAMFAERQYNAILSSPDTIRLKVYVERKKEEIKVRDDDIRRNPTLQQLRKSQAAAKRQLEGDEKFLEQHCNARDSFLEQAIDMYSRCLESSDEFDSDGPIRLCSLWFANFEAASLHNIVQQALGRVPSRKLVFLAHQLSARLSKSQNEEPLNGQETLQRLVLRMCEEHPFHSLYQVYCLQPDRALKANRRSSNRHSPMTSQTDRGAAADEIFDRLRSDASNSDRLRDVEKLCNASLEWAKWPIINKAEYNKAKVKAPFKLPNTASIGTIKNLHVPVMTAKTPIDATLRYDNCVWIERYDSTFDTAGGLSLPKINVCRGNDGQKYKQLFKGEGADDLRQDAVMEQVFELVNRVLQRDRETRRRSLRVRDYKVIPLAAQAGVLEFVGNTAPLQSWLSTAHPRYRPNDMKIRDVISLLKAKQDETGSEAEPMLEVYTKIRERFKPVMRHYFTERHRSPMTWFHMRLCYTRSVATTSIVGHVLGLGDRHVSNILLDNGSGEVVHIDLGIAFDQGKLLKIPERVPFRMTPDIVDGMGTSGTQGVFQRCAEETLRVLRDGSDVIMTVLEVFKHDPLHSWTASAVKIQRVQGMHNDPSANLNKVIGIDMWSGTVEEDADRALASVARKLEKSLSVESTVNALIAEATDPVNLARIFYGWSPYY